jgi:hypothetical protein
MELEGKNSTDCASEETVSEIHIEREISEILNINNLYIIDKKLVASE